MEGHGLGHQCGAGWLLVRRLLAQLNVTRVEVDIAGGRFRFAGTAIVHLKVYLQFKLRYGLDSEEIHKSQVHRKGHRLYFQKIFVKFNLMGNTDNRIMTHKKLCVSGW